MDSFNSTHGVPPPFGMKDLDRLAYVHLFFNAWHAYAQHEAHQRDLQRAAAEASAPVTTAVAVPQAQPAAADQERLQDGFADRSRLRGVVPAGLPRPGLRGGPALRGRAGRHLVLIPRRPPGRDLPITMSR